jgi:hypothetical protein
MITTGPWRQVEPALSEISQYSDWVVNHDYEIDDKVKVNYYTLTSDEEKDIGKTYYILDGTTYETWSGESFYIETED